jgi:hypothetical protein
VKSRTLAERLRLIVDVVFDGNARLAARTARLEAPAFHRLLTGIVENPRISTITRLSGFFGLPVEYLLGTMSAGTADQSDEQLAEEFWLLWTHYSHRQRNSRDWLAAVTQKMSPAERRGHQNLINLKNVFLFPFHQASPLRATMGAALSASPPRARSVEIVRQVLMSETELLELAVATLKADGYHS